MAGATGRSTAWASLAMTSNGHDSLQDVLHCLRVGSERTIWSSAAFRRQCCRQADGAALVFVLPVSGCVMSPDRSKASTTVRASTFCRVHRHQLRGGNNSQLRMLQRFLDASVMSMDG